MLGLGNDIIHNSFGSSEISTITGFLSLATNDSPTTEFMFIMLFINNGENIGTITDVENKSVGDKVGGNFSLKVDNINSSGQIFGTATFDVYGYKYTDDTAHVSYIALSEVNSSSLSISTFEESGSSLINLDTKIVTISEETGLYDFTLTVSESGYLDGTVLEENVSHYTD